MVSCTYAKKSKRRHRYYKGQVVSWRGLATYTDPNTLSFVASGGDGYSMFPGAKVLVTAANGARDLVTLTSYLKAHPNLTPRTEGRITQP